MQQRLAPQSAASIFHTMSTLVWIAALLSWRKKKKIWTVKHQSVSLRGTTSEKLPEGFVFPHQVHTTAQRPESGERSVWGPDAIKSEAKHICCYSNTHTHTHWTKAGAPNTNNWIWQSDWTKFRRAEAPTFTTRTNVIMFLQQTLFLHSSVV